MVDHFRRPALFARAHRRRIQPREVATHGVEHSP
jgi:hypothetical protein